MVVEDAEVRVAHVRVRTILTWGLVVWAALAATDVATSSEAGTLGLGYFLAVRVASVVVVLACIAALRSTRLALIGTIAFSTLAIACALLAVGGRGLASPQIGTLMIVLVAQGLAYPDRMMPTLARLGATVAIFTVALFVGVALREAPSNDLGIYFQYSMTTLAVPLLMANLGKAYWSLRQQLFEQRVVGRYRLGRMLGAGGMGQVWTADHPGLGREVAVKLLRPTDASAEMIARFETEIHALTDLASPHTVRVYDCGTTDDGYWYYVMERLTGATLTHAVRTDGVFPGKRAIGIARQIATALAEAHAAGIVHRDLKPDNLFLTTVGADRDFVKVLDFGVAKRALASRLTQTGVAVGTPAFMAPEQALSRDVDGRTDVYALGAVLFHMLTGRPPFTAESNAILMLAAVHDETPRASSLAVGVPAALDELIDRCLAKDLRDRPGSMVELERELAELERDYDALPIAPTPTAASPVASGDAPTFVARR